MQVNQPDTAPRPFDSRLFLREDELDRGIGLLLAAHRRLQEALNHVDSNVSQSERSVLLAIYAAPGRSVSDLRTEMGASTPTFARLLGALDEKGLIERRKSINDGRARTLWLSDAGMSECAPFLRAARETLSAAYRDAGAEAVGGARLVLDALAAVR
ncbi:MAG: MarR family transcriptional regulator [Pseudomonadota bacterium]